MSSVVRQRQSLMFRARSYTGFVIMPRPPIVEWLTDLDFSLEELQGLFCRLSDRRRSVGRDLEHERDHATARQPRGAQYPHPRHRRPRSGSYGAGTAADPARGPQYAVGRAVARRRAGLRTLPRRPRRSRSSRRSWPRIRCVRGNPCTSSTATSPCSARWIGRRDPRRGSIHIYGTLRGRAMAGATGNARARIFCHRVEAELLSIDGYYKVAEDIDESLRQDRSRSGSKGIR